MHKTHSHSYLDTELSINTGGPGQRSNGCQYNYKDARIPLPETACVLRTCQHPDMQHCMRLCRLYWCVDLHCYVTAHRLAQPPQLQSYGRDQRRVQGNGKKGSGNARSGTDVERNLQISSYCTEVMPTDVAVLSTDLHGVRITICRANYGARWQSCLYTTLRNTCLLCRPRCQEKVKPPSAGTIRSALLPLKM
jgi:hypothetical protein